MNVILGIDTGGTFTDAVILDADTKKLLFQSKSQTRKENLSGCIGECFQSIPRAFLPEISMVCLSTTLATNAIVEGNGCRAGLILIGKQPDGVLPADSTVLIDGLYDIKGREVRPPRAAEVREAAEALRGRVDAVAISGYASVRNPAHELYVSDLIRQQTDVPVVCAHALSGRLGFYDRTVTAVLNARLIPLICDLMESVDQTMHASQVQAPLMVVRGDGTLMTAARARSKPIDTILSGPVASVTGGLYLSGLQDALVVDIGGTTTDVAHASGGAVRTRDEGAKVGGWLTQVRAAEVYTVGLGGDSMIQIREHGVGAQNRDVLQGGAESDSEDRSLQGNAEEYCIQIGPGRVLPACRRAGQTVSDSAGSAISGAAEREDQTDQLQSALTPTDLLHCAGICREWDTAAAKTALEAAAGQMHLTPEAACELLLETVNERLKETLEEARQYFEADADGKPVVLIGAPAEAWSARLQRDLGIPIIVPAHAEVANAVGTAVGRDIEQIEMLIRQDSVTGKYIAYTPAAREAFDTLEEAAQYAVEAGEMCLRNLSGSRSFETQIEQRDITLGDAAGEHRVFVERQILLCALYREA